MNFPSCQLLLDETLTCVKFCISLPLPVEVTLTLETDEVRVAEKSSVKVEIRKLGACERPVSVRVYTESGSAKGMYI